MSKETAYIEMCKDFDNGKREWTFDEMGVIAEKHLGISSNKTKEILSELSKTDKEVRS